MSFNEDISEVDPRRPSWWARWSWAFGVVGWVVMTAAGVFIARGERPPLPNQSDGTDTADLQEQLDSLRDEMEDLKVHLAAVQEGQGGGDLRAVEDALSAVVKSQEEQRVRELALISLAVAVVLGGLLLFRVRKGEIERNVERERDRQARELKLKWEQLEAIERRLVQLANDWEQRLQWLRPRE